MEQEAPEATQSITVDACIAVVEAASNACERPAAPAPPVVNTTDWDALAASFGSLSAAFAWGSILLAVLTILAAFAWGKLVSRAAEKEAKEVAKTCAEEYIHKWMATEAPRIIREKMDMLQDATLGSGDDARAADDLGKEAG